MAHVLITGGSRGIGAAMVRTFARAGYSVTFTYRASQSAAEALAAETGAAAIRADSADPAEIAQAVARATAERGGVDVLINNAAVSTFRLFTDLTDGEWRHTMAVNLDAAFYYTRAVLPHMIHLKSGRILNVSSVWGLVGASCEVHYATSKAALIGMTKSLAKELGPSGITVNCIAPGVVDTDMNAALSAEDLAALRDEIPLGRLGTPQEIADLALYLASPAGAYLTGQVISPNGGMVI